MEAFIIGTDTGVGKTYVGAQIAKLFLSDPNFAVLKILESGITKENFDTSDIKKYSIQERKIPLDESFFRVFSNPLNVKSAAEIENQKIVTVLDIESWIDGVRKQFKLPHLLLETVGGLLVNLNANETYLDVISKRKANVLLVVANKLGCLNHLSLTLEALTARSLKGWVILNGTIEGIDPILEHTNEIEVKRITSKYQFKYLSYLRNEQILDLEQIEPLRNYFFD